MAEVVRIRQAYDELTSAPSSHPAGQQHGSTPTTKATDVSISFTHPAGYNAVLKLEHGARDAAAYVSIASIDASVYASARLEVEGLRRLVDGMLDAIDAIERNRRLKLGS
ncbi:hypothetical protein N7373_15090 [Achromobacter mucicolens]|uniref:hypothetical protein n=1 Tax=Achromobacter mucicolens TaxID=1389922 RepID=UPI00244A6A54|nr:hypothetical protein [Achromobacter mucicolens]MDH0092776.1 hypothetical protein [Achromobacter mucicolens]